MLFLYGLTILAGIANAIQPGQNATLSKSLGLPVTAGLITLLVSTVALLLGGLAIGKLEVPTGQQLAQVPWWAWLGGLFSVLLILAQLYASPAIGAASFLGIIVTVGVAASIVLDNYGWVGFPVHPASLWRILGAVLMVAGVALVALF
ncbi:DMT family transporter [Methylobacterium sp. yr668]|jgi:bacterial/archaeal transporter family-2 protein|uniref:DMT family transporter n=1 Tax=Methylobacterium sp. yr668 TaxID=1761801 RepID=UPI0008F418D9|nr:DMT family transporter [Methylobacterium sp. yr668]SFT28268.1 transporter family-2 protein [Methylobacterium sp. yr668]